jgi:Ca2+-binding EF-hand superfamily protein
MKRVSLLIIGLLASATVLAQTAAPSPQDGGRERWKERADAKFGEADSNHDGNISQSEWQSASLRAAKEHFQKLDANRDGKLTRAEMDAGRSERMAGRMHGREERRERLQALDKDGDQQLSRSEIGDSMPRLSADFDRLDSNRDGKLSREEIRAGREQHRGGEAR